jgi:hypothetical protein
MTGGAVSTFEDCYFRTTLKGTAEAIQVPHVMLEASGSHTSREESPNISGKERSVKIMNEWRLT